MMKLAFCDDDQEIAALLEGYARSWAQETEHVIECRRFENGKDFLFAWNSMSMFDIVFLDIKMEYLSGLELAKIIRCVDHDVSLVFVTGYSEFALDGYSVDAASYLLKPVSRESFFDCMNRLTRRASLEQKAFFIEKGGQIIKFLYSELLYFEVHSHTITAHSLNGTTKFRTRLSDIENSLSPQDGFVRIHRSFLVNIKKVRVMDRNSLVMENDARLPIGQSYSREVYNEYIRQNNK